MFCPSCGQPPPRTLRLRCRYLPLAHRLASLLPLIYRNSTARQPRRTFDSVADLLRARRSDPGRPSTIPASGRMGLHRNRPFSPDRERFRGLCTILIIVGDGGKDDSGFFFFFFRYFLLLFSPGEKVDVLYIYIYISFFERKKDSVKHLMLSLKNKCNKKMSWKRGFFVMRFYYDLYGIVAI